MGEMVELDQAIDRMGYLRLSTVERYTRHMGNVLTPGLLAEARTLGLPVDPEVVPSLTHRRHWLVRIPGVRRTLLALYNRLYNLLQEIG